MLSCIGFLEFKINPEAPYKKHIANVLQSYDKFFDISLQTSHNWDTNVCFLQHTTKRKTVLYQRTTQFYDQGVC